MQANVMEPFVDTPIRVHYVLKDKDGIYVGHCVEIPSVIVYGKTQQEVEAELQKSDQQLFRSVSRTAKDNSARRR
jgi:hypothetical protein